MADVKPINARRGSGLWGINTFRTFLLEKFLDSLARLESGGLSDEQCLHVQKCLKEIIEEFDKLPEGGFVKPIVKDQFVKFQEIYVTWNSVNGSTPAAVSRRKIELTKLRKHRKKLSRKISNGQQELSTEVDDKFFESLWNNLEKISLKYPNEFKRLSVAMRRARAALTNTKSASA